MRIPFKLAAGGAALVLAVASAALARLPVQGRAATSAEAPAPATLEPFALAALLAEAPPDVVVVAVDPARHPLRGAVPIATLAASDDAFVASAPRRRVVIVAMDEVRADRIARRLHGQGTNARVLQGGVSAWDRAMDADPAPPPAGAPFAAWDAHKRNVALRHAFGDADNTPSAAPIVPAMVAPVAAPGGGAPKKREGC
jgi:rhodanese-related sulfurtransferase